MSSVFQTRGLFVHLGKSYYLSYLLVQCLLDGRKVIFQGQVTHFYLFDEKGVTCREARTMDSLAHDDTMCDTTPPEIIMKCLFFVIHVSSPVKKNYHHWVKQRRGRKLYMSPWSWGEVESAAR